MAFLDDLVTSGRIADLGIAVIVIEGLWLAFARKRQTAAPLLPNLAAGLFLMLALRFALTLPSPALPVLVCLAGSLVAHLADMAARLRHTRSAP